MSMMVYTGTPARYISITASECRECVLILLGLKPRRALPMVAQADLSIVITCLDVICSCLTWFQTVQTEVSSEMPDDVQI